MNKLNRYISILSLLVLFIACESTTKLSDEDPMGREIIDYTELVAVSTDMNAARMAKDYEKFADFLTDDASFTYPSGKIDQGKDAIIKSNKIIDETISTLPMPSDSVIYLAIKGKDPIQGDYKILMAWDVNTIKAGNDVVDIMQHNVTWFTAENKIERRVSFYDRSQIQKFYQTDPLVSDME
tara:strand:- start:143 stop:688 length:546 start_codon:yes stop_codon:yes gene_type:complete